MKPFSDNIIFWDAEFSGFDFCNGQILSIGMVKLNGEELYFELEQEKEICDWVKENVVPFLKQEKISKGEAIKRITEFVGDNKPYLISNVIVLDAPFLNNLFGINNEKGNKLFPFHWILLDFASMLFALGIDPERLTSKFKDKFVRDLGINIDRYKKHHALDDAKLLRDVYLKLLDK
ncbi:MAG: 3'-5' exoribonuclease [Nanoarchaeota archaeon]|nr:3'-5' exoribonuclease [Nanoarchaeota archaeon]